jgi:DNA primase catalytic subunit
MKQIKILLFSCIVLILSCKTGTKVVSVPSKKSQAVRVDLRVIKNDAEAENKTRLLFTFYNDFTSVDSTLCLSFPCLQETVALRLFSKGVEQDIQKLIRVTGECSKKLTEVKPNDSVEIELNYYLDDLFEIDRNAKYVLEISYYGVIYLKDSKLLKDNRSLIFKTIDW